VPTERASRLGLNPLMEVSSRAHAQVMTPDRARHAALVARDHVQRAVGLLTDNHDQRAVVQDAAEAIHAAHDHLDQGRWDDARCPLVTARGRLARPGSRHDASSGDEESLVRISTDPLRYPRQRRRRGGVRGPAINHLS
jgi:hypothetical protein